MGVRAYPFVPAGGRPGRRVPAGAGREAGGRSPGGRPRGRPDGGHRDPLVHRRRAAPGTRPTSASAWPAR